MYMNYTLVIIVSSDASQKRAPSITFLTWLSIFVANLQNSYTTIVGTDVSFPNLGQDITDISMYPSGVVGTYQAVGGSGGS